MSDVINALQTTLMALGHSGLLANVNSALFNATSLCPKNFWVSNVILLKYLEFITLSSTQKLELLKMWYMLKIFSCVTHLITNMGSQNYVSSNQFNSDNSHLLLMDQIFIMDFVLGCREGA